MAARALKNLKTVGEFVAEEINDDEDFRVEWERTAPAREVAAQLIIYRSKHGLTQRQLAEKLGVSQPRVVKLESGEHNPEIDTLIKLSHELGLEFVINVVPAGRNPKLVTKKVKETRTTTAADNRVSVLVASA
jgi:DNA-binding XRE family transcriptional regulator